MWPLATPQPLFAPPLKWAGGKRWLAPLIRERFWEKHSGRRLVEPFVGGMAVALSLLPRRALLNDMNPPSDQLLPAPQKRPEGSRGAV
ncbi:DNA adenine methylase [Meiothermus luteus]|uniref:DNA adenine methylase n=1 Tax=Meiothermus luteus TaxID=2026184 RepID=UPI0038B33ADA